MRPTDLGMDENPGWSSGQHHFWDFYTLWDTYRTVMPLYTLILPERQREIVRCLLDIYDHRGWLPDAWTAGDYAYVQGGSNADVVIADAVVKKLGGFDVAHAYEAVKKKADVVSDNPTNTAVTFTNTRNTATFRTTSGMAVPNRWSMPTTIIVSHRSPGPWVLKTTGRDMLPDRAAGFICSIPGPVSSGPRMPKEIGCLGFSPVFRRPDYWNGPYFYEVLRGTTRPMCLTTCSG